MGSEHDQQAIRPCETTRVLGTDLEVWHDGRFPVTVTVLGDGAVDLPCGPNWIVKAVK